MAREDSRSPEAAKASFRRLFDANPMPMWIYDLETLRFLAVNDAACDKYGYSRPEFLRMTIRDIRPPEDVPALERAVREPLPRSLDDTLWRHRCNDGSLVLVEVSAHDIVHAGRRARFVCLHDVTRRVALERALAASERGLGRAQELARLSHLVTDADGRFMEWSRTFAALIGAREDRVPATAREWLALVHPEDREAFRAMAIEARRSGTRMEIGYRIRRADGAWIHVRQVVEPIDGSQPVRWFSTLQDVSVQKEAEAEVRRLNRDLEARVAERTRDLQAAVKDLEAFTFMVSHDLRAPLRAIDGFAALLAEPPGSVAETDRAGVLGRIRAQVGRMGQLIDDLLKFARAGRQALREEPLDLHALVATSLELFREEVAWRGVRVSVGPLPACRGDAALVGEVLQNLLDNAIKYTRGREAPEVAIGTAELDGTPAIFVRDNGAGFDMRDAGGLFEVFQRLHTDREFEGTGVGLAIVRQIVERHGGRVMARASPGEGATFLFTLPGRPGS